MQKLYGVKVQTGWSSAWSDAKRERWRSAPWVRWTQLYTWHPMSQSVNLQSDKQCWQGWALPRLDSTAPVITSTLFSLSVTVYQITVTQKCSSFFPADKRRGSAAKIRSRPRVIREVFLWTFKGRGFFTFYPNWDASLWVCPILITDKPLLNFWTPNKNDNCG